MAPFAGTKSPDELDAACRVVYREGSMGAGRVRDDRLALRGPASS
jgi:hypothetical protein